MTGLNQVDEMAAVRKKLRRVMGHLLARRIENRRRHGHAAGGRHTVQLEPRISLEQDYAIAAPGACPHATRRITQRLRRSSPDVGGLQLAIGEETDGATVV